MNECRRIEPLLPLYRDGELSDLERSKVIAHVDTCPRCKSLLQQFRAIDAALGPARENAPDLPTGARVADRVLDRLASQRSGWSKKRGRVPTMSELLYWFRPALSVAVVAAVAVLVAQQTRDAMMIASLENRLRAQGDIASEETSLVSSATRLLAGFAAIQEEQGTSVPSPTPNAAMAEDPLRVLGRGLMGLFHQDRGLLEVLSRRYPHLSEVKLDDGIDERERKILDTEGKAFLKDFEQLIREGAQ